MAVSGGLVPMARTLIVSEPQGWLCPGGVGRDVVALKAPKLRGRGRSKVEADYQVSRSVSNLAAARGKRCSLELCRQRHRGVRVRVVVAGAPGKRH